MTAYGPQGIPRGRAGGPGWPRAGASVGAVGDPTGFPAKVIFVRTNQVVQMPDWATFYRVTAEGNGATGAVDSRGGGGGGGGACSGTSNTPEKASPGAAIQVRFTPTATVVAVLGYLLSAGHGTPGDFSSAGVGGVATGGAVNFNGGNGAIATGTTWSGGGGAASRAGPGGAAPGGGLTTGGAGTLGNGYFSGSAPGGMGAPGSTTVPPSPAQTQVGLGALGAVLQIGTAASSSSGGDGGGGSGAVDSSSRPNVPGAGYALIEFW